MLIARFLLPYFPKADLEDVIRIKDTESDSFLLFDSYLRQRLAALSEAQSLNDIDDILAEIAAGTARLRLEAKKVAASKLIRNAETGSLVLSLVGMAFSDPAYARMVAGMIGSASVISLLKSFSEVRGKKLDMRANEFFVPYLLGSRSADAMIDAG
jgi:hypothetical protein